MIQFNRGVLCTYRISVLFFSLIIVVAVIRLVTIFSTAPGSVLASNVAKTSQNAAGQVRALPELHLFREVDAWGPFHIGAIDPHSEEIKAAPRSSLSFILTGILFSRKPGESRVILSDSGQQMMLSTGDSLPGVDAEIVRIFNDRIIVAHQGKYESISIERDDR